MPMDLAQLEQMVSWLDEERRKDKEELARIRQRMENQLQASEEQIRRFQELDARQASLQTQVAKLAQLNQAMDQFRKEIVGLVEQGEQKAAAALRESDRTRLLEREAQTQALSEMRKQVDTLPRLEESLEARRTEEQRLNQMILEQRTKTLNIQERVEERTHAIRILEEQRANDGKRIAQLNETATQLLRRAEDQSAKAQVLEDGLRKSEQQLAGLQNAREDLRAQQQEFMEEVRLRDEQRKRQMEEWARDFERNRKTMSDFASTMQLYKDFYDKNRHALESLEKLQTHLSQRQSELDEMRRLSDERQKKQLQEWREENEKRWKQEALSTEYAWNAQQRENDAAVKRLAQLEQAAVTLDSDLAQIWTELNKDVSNQLGLLHQRQADLDAYIGGRTKRNRAAAPKKAEADKE